MHPLDLTNNLYGFSLSGQTSRILWKLKNVDMCYEVWSNNIDHYLKMLIHDQPKYILGMGTYTGVDKENIRIETVTKNQFRNDVIENDFPISKQIVINPFVKESENTKLASALGNSWCNLISYKIMRLIENKELNSKYTFLHIPSSFKFDYSIEVIENILTNISS